MTSISNTMQRQRLIQLDFLRGVAILLVLFHHSALHNVALGSMAPVLDPLISFGWVGVTLFFVLSGFLVGGLLFKEIRRTGAVDARRFLARRAFKIWPPYFIFVGYIFVKLLRRQGSFREAFLTLWPNFLHIQNYVATPPQHTWSLAVEEHFYLGFAILIVFLMRGGGEAAQRRLKVIPWTALSLLVACLALRSLNWNKPFDNYTHLWPTQLCMDSLFLGVCLGYLYYFKPEVFERWASHRLWLVLLGLGALSPIVFVPKTAPFVFTFGMTLLSLGFACLLAAVVPLPSQKGQPPGRFWNNPLIRGIGWIGIYSYSIYLWHLDLVTHPLLTLLESHWSGWPPTAKAGVYLALHLTGSILAGFIMAKMIEFPALHLRDRLVPASARRSRQPGAAGHPEPLPITDAAIMNPASLQ